MSFKILNNVKLCISLNISTLNFDHKIDSILFNLKRREFYSNEKMYSIAHKLYITQKIIDEYHFIEFLNLSHINYDFYGWNYITL